MEIVNLTVEISRLERKCPQQLKIQCIRTPGASSGRLMYKRAFRFFNLFYFVAFVFFFFVKGKVLRRLYIVCFPFHRFYTNSPERKYPPKLPFLRKRLDQVQNRLHFVRCYNGLKQPQAYKTCPVLELYVRGQSYLWNVIYNKPPNTNFAFQGFIFYFWVQIQVYRIQLLLFFIFLKITKYRKKPSKCVTRFNLISII